MKRQKSFIDGLADGVQALFTLAAIGSWALIALAVGAGIGLLWLGIRAFL